MKQSAPNGANAKPNERPICLETTTGVFSPFTGIGSEGYTALKMGRRFIGSELKESYYNIAKNNLEAALSEGNDQLNLFETEYENDNI